MGDDKNISRKCTGPTEWDIWVANVTPTGLNNVTKITPTDGSRNEDPKFSSDGTKIIFKKTLPVTQPLPDGNRYLINSINTADFTVDGTNQTPTQTILLDNPFEMSMPYYLVGSNTDFVFAAENSIQADLGGSVSILYAPLYGGTCYYPVALNRNQFYYAGNDSNGQPDQIFTGDISKDTPVPAAFDNAYNEIADPAPMNADWVAFTTWPVNDPTYEIWIGNFNTKNKAYNLDSWIPKANRVALGVKKSGPNVLRYGFNSGLDR